MSSATQWAFLGVSPNLIAAKQNAADLQQVFIHFYFNHQDRSDWKPSRAPSGQGTKGRKTGMYK
jgi:hypothetical protein